MPGHEHEHERERERELQPAYRGLLPDQRTALSPRDLRQARGDRSLLRQMQSGGDPSPAPATAHTPRTQFCTGRYRHIRNYYPRFGELFVRICFLGLIHSSIAAPPQRLSTRNMDAHPLWINPCGGGTIDDNLMQDDTPLSNKDLFEPVELQAKTALSDAEKLKHDYVKKTFKVDFNEHHKTWKHVNYKWLPGAKSIPKELGGEVSLDHLQHIESDMEASFAEMYADLQRIAVGLEQADHDITGSSKKIFNNAKYFLKELLCELHALMNYRGYSRKPDITRDEMGDEFRNMSSESDRNLRDWIIFREYMNAMEYVAQVFKFFGSKP